MIIILIGKKSVINGGKSDISRDIQKRSNTPHFTKSGATLRILQKIKTSIFYTLPNKNATS